MSDSLKVFIGFDARERVAFDVLAHSIWQRASIPVSITPLIRQQLAGIYTRERGPTESTDFAMTRFLVPYLCGYQGQAIFMDCDMLCQVDFADILPACGDDFGEAVYVCQHDYVPKTHTKFLGQAQTAYPRKNWSSFMVFDNERCRALTPEYVNQASGLELHRFKWLEDYQVGSLPLEFNWLVGEYEPNGSAKILHYTLGGPWFDDSLSEENARWWWQYEAMRLQATAQPHRLLKEA